jgi:hypothetical protein
MWVVTRVERVRPLPPLGGVRHIRNISILISFTEVMIRTRDLRRRRKGRMEASEDPR